MNEDIEPLVDRPGHLEFDASRNVNRQKEKEYSSESFDLKCSSKATCIFICCLLISVLLLVGSISNLNSTQNPHDHDTSNSAFGKLKKNHQKIRNYVRGITNAPTKPPKDSSGQIAKDLVNHAGSADSSTYFPDIALSMSPEYNTPSQIRLALSHDADMMLVHFTAIERRATKDDTCEGAFPKYPFSVRYWYHDDNDQNELNNRKQTVEAVQIGCYKYDGFEPRWHFFMVKLTNLVPNKLYHYQIGQKNVPIEEKSSFAIAENSFITVGDGDSKPMLSQSGKPLPAEKQVQTILTVGDMEMPGSVDVFTAMETHDATAVLHLGDTLYATNNGECYLGPLKNPPDFCDYDCPKEKKCAGRDRQDPKFQQEWIKWSKYMQRISATIPWMTTMGNHDNDLQWFLKFRPPVNASMPGVQQIDLPKVEVNELRTLKDMMTKRSLDQQIIVNEINSFPYFYSFNYGMMHVVAIGSEDNAIDAYERLLDAKDIHKLSPRLEKRFQAHYGPNSPQYKWLIRDLENANLPENRKKYPWIVLMTHRPLYHTAEHHGMCQLNGDWYSCRYRDQYVPVLQKYSVNLVLSGHSHHYQRTHQMRNMQRVKDGEPNAPVYVVCGTGGYDMNAGFAGNPPWIAFRQGRRYGFCRFELYNATHMKFHHFDTNNKELDGAWIRQPEPS